VGKNVELFTFGQSQGIPNSRLPVVVQHGIQEIDGAPDACERLFAGNGWGGSWRDGIFPFHHFHSNAHEVLGIVSGAVTARLGGPDGQSVRLVAGDVAILPAGTGHKREDATGDLLVIGAYPLGQENYDIRRGEPDELLESIRNIESVALPGAGPVEGSNGALVEAWALR
jgi:uncharacterized protein YjlB